MSQLPQIRLAIAPQQIWQRQIILNPQQQHYLRRVMRLRVGDSFLAMDGKGKVCLAKLEEDNAKLIKDIVIKTELPVNLTLIVALPKGNGFAEIIRGCTELGVTRFIPTISERTLLKPSSNKLIRWQKIAAEAAEQSERTIIPQIDQPKPFQQVLAEIQTQKSACYICVARGNLAPLWQSLRDCPHLTIATGCEGGWTKTEVEQAIKVGFQPVSLGNRILRAVTAPLVVSSLVAAKSEIFSQQKIDKLNCLSFDR